MTNKAKYSRSSRYKLPSWIQKTHDKNTALIGGILLFVALAPVASLVNHIGNALAGVLLGVSIFLLVKYRGKFSKSLRTLIVIWVIGSVVITMIPIHSIITKTSSTQSSASSEGFLPDIPDPNHGIGYKNNRVNIFGRPWLDINHNGCDTRNDILARDLTDIKIGYSSRCPNATVLSGTLHDPYTDKIIHFKRTSRTSSIVQIDHIIPLGYAYKHGAWKLAKEGRKDIIEKFANDPLNLLAVDGRANMQKSDLGPSKWMPSNPKFQCGYVKHFLAVYQKYSTYGIRMARADWDKIQSVIAHCK